MAEHYRNPYPRPVNLPKRSFSKMEGKKVGKAIQKMNEQSRPVYIRYRQASRNPGIIDQRVPDRILANSVGHIRNLSANI